MTLGQGALASKGGAAFAKMFAAEVVSEAAAGTTVIVCDKAGVPSAVTISLALLLGTTAGMAANKALIPEDFSKWMTKEEASRYNQYWSDVQGRQGLKDYNYYGVLEDGFYKDLTVAGKYKNFDFSAYEGSGKLKPQGLIDELANSGVKYNPDDVVSIIKNSDGKLMWLENGNSKAGLQHILERHADDFASQGVNNIPSLLEDVLSTNPIKTGSNAKGLFADYSLNGNSYRVAYGTNGYIVSFYPID
ncbi:MAG: hypothetical protein K0R05_2796 [Anaerocolumna sp.]|nr:hypothetical protein [Anaerocolumna sp.]